MFLSGHCRPQRPFSDAIGPPARFRFVREDGRRASSSWLPAKESGSGRDVVFTQADVENLIRTKGAIYAAADSLVRSVGLSFADIQKVYIAGAFGNRLDIGHCIAIGLLPDVPAERIDSSATVPWRGRSW